MAFSWHSCGIPLVVTRLRGNQEEEEVKEEAEEEEEEEETIYGIAEHPDSAPAIFLAERNSGVIMHFRKSEQPLTHE